MSKKRFTGEVLHTIGINELNEKGEIIDYWTVDEIVKKLNELSTENRQLKQELEDMGEVLDSQKEIIDFLKKKDKRSMEAMEEMEHEASLVDSYICSKGLSLECHEYCIEHYNDEDEVLRVGYE